MADAKLSAILSFFIPGLGQGVNGEVKRGAIFFVIAVILHFAIAYLVNNRFGMIIQLAYSLYAAYDAYQLSQ